MKPLTIADAQTMILALQDEIRRSEVACYDHRLHGVLLVAHGLTCPQAAELPQRRPALRQSWVKRFETNGFAGLTEQPKSGRPGRLSPCADGKDRRAALSAKPPARARPDRLQPVGWQDAGHIRAPRVGRGLGSAPVSAAVSTVKFPAAQAAPGDWPPPTPRGRQPIKNSTPWQKTRAVDLYGPWTKCISNNTARAARMWIAPEIKDPVLLHHPTRKSVGYFGAVRLRDGKFVFAREPNTFDAQTTWGFLQQARQASRLAGRRVVMIIDNARYHHAILHAQWRQEQQPDFTLAYLPPYSPDLKPAD